MRLIDADTLNYVRVRIYHGDGTIGGYNAVVPSSEIKNAPTVDAEPVIRCKDCGQREYGCSTFIDHNQIYGFCAWGWKAERKEE